METIITKEELSKFKKIKGEVTGDCIKNDLDFILKKEGEEGLKRVEMVMGKLGFPIDRAKLKLTDIYPLSFPVTLIVVVKRLFNYNKKDLENMGRMEAKISSTIIRLFMKYFVSFDMLANNAQKMWEEHYKIGNLRVIDHSRNKGYVHFRIENFKAHVFICHVLGGYFAGLLEMIVGKKVTVEEVKCEHRGDAYHELHLTW